MTELCYRRPMMDRIFSQDVLVNSAILRIGADRNAATTPAKGAAWFEARPKCIVQSREQQCCGGIASLQPSPPSDLPRYSHNVAFFRQCRRASDQSTSSHVLQRYHPV